MSPAPQDIARLPWRRLASDAWTDATFRAPVLLFIRGFLDNHPWVAEWEVLELFTDTVHANRAGSVNVRVPFGPTGPPQDEIRQRDGLPILILAFVRYDSVRFEVGLPFADGKDAASQTIDRLLDTARLSIEAQERATARR